MFRQGANRSFGSAGAPAATEPDAPTIGTAVATGATSAHVPFTAPGSNGGATITQYRAISTPGSITGTLNTAGSGTINVTGLDPETAYTFTVSCINSEGRSAESAASNEITTEALSDSEFIVLVGPNHASSAFNIGPADRATPADIEAARTECLIPWTTFADADEHFSDWEPADPDDFPTDWVKAHPWGNPGLLYNEVAAGSVEEFPLALGHQAGYLYPRLASDFAVINTHLALWPSRAGARGYHITNPYTTYHGHTRIRADNSVTMSAHAPFYIGLRMDGLMTALLRNGSVDHLHQFAGITATPDFAFDFLSTFTFAPTRIGRFFYVVDAGTPGDEDGRVLKIDRESGFTDPVNFPNLEDSSLWTITELVTDLDFPISVRVDGEGEIYITESGAGDLLRVTDAETGATEVIFHEDPGLITGVPSPYLRSGVFWVDYCSDSGPRANHLVISGLKGFVIELDEDYEEVERHEFGITEWTTVSVDRFGRNGPVNNYNVIKSLGGGGNNDAWGQDAAGDFVLWPIDHGIGYKSVGDALYVFELYSHYGWVLEFHPDEPGMLSQGSSDICPALIMPKPSTWPTFEAYDSTADLGGINILRYGTGPDEPYYDWPTFYSQINKFGWSYAGVTADRLALMEFDDIRDYIQAGMLGSVPRPQIVGLYLWWVGYRILTQSQRYLQEGVTLMDDWEAYCTPTIGDEAAAIDQPLFDIERMLHVDIVADGDEMEIQFKDDEEIERTPPDDLEVEVWVNEIFDNKIYLGTFRTVAAASHEWRFLKPPLTEGQHSIRAKAILTAPTTTWEANTEYAVGDFVIPTTDNACRYEATAASGDSESGSSEPTWGLTLGATTSDGDITWACRLRYFRSRTSVILGEGLPAWMEDQAVGEWREIPNTNLDSVPYYGSLGAVGPVGGKQDAWNGFHGDLRNSEMLSVGNGGHTDYYGNEVDGIELEVDEPEWVERLTSSVMADIPQNPANNDYYDDGRWGSRHSYQTGIIVEATNRAMWIGAGSRTTIGNPGAKVDGFALLTDACDPAGTYDDLPFTLGAGNWIVSKHPVTEDAYIWNTNNAVYKWNHVTSEIATVSTEFPATDANKAGGAIDPTRGVAGKFLVLGGMADPCLFDIAAGTFEEVTLTGAAAGDVDGNYPALMYSRAMDKFLFRSIGAGGKLIQIDPANNWECVDIGLTGGTSLPAAVNAVCTNAIFFPRLSRVIYGPAWGENLWALRTGGVG